MFINCNKCATVMQDVDKETEFEVYGNSLLTLHFSLSLE